MRAGKLRHRITLLKYSHTQDASGDTIATWIDDSKIWASIEPLSVKDVLSAKAADSEMTTRCVTRYHPDITSAMRIKHGVKTYQIDGDPLPDAKSGREYMTLMLKDVSHE